MYFENGVNTVVGDGVHPKKLCRQLKGTELTEDGALIVMIYSAKF
jgi:hypothetical protein